MDESGRKEMPMLTHKGWFGICPVYLANPFSPAPFIVERHWALLPLFLLSEVMFSAIFMLGSLLPNFQPFWAIKITGEIKPK